MAKIVSIEGRGAKAPVPRRGMPSPRLDEAEFKRRYRQQFADRAFEAVRSQIDQISDIAWGAYESSRKSPITRKAGSEFANPDYDLSVDWLSAREAIRAAHERHADDV